MQLRAHYQIKYIDYTELYIYKNLWHTFLQILGTILPVSTGHTSYRGLFFISWVESKKPGQSSILVRDKKKMLWHTLLQIV